MSFEIHFNLSIGDSSNSLYVNSLIGYIQRLEMSFVGRNSVKENGCGFLRDALFDLKPVMTALYEFHENLHVQRKSFLEEKKRKLAQLRGIKEELAADCKLHVNVILSSSFCAFSFHENSCR